MPSRTEVALALLAFGLSLSGCANEPVARAPAEESRSSSGLRLYGECDSASYPGPWTACPEAQEVRRVLEHAGFEVIFDQGAAWHVTDHKTATFSVGVTETPARRLRSHPMIKTIDGVRVRGDPATQLVWHAVGHAWWLQPQGVLGQPDDRLPSGDALARVVRASLSADIANPS